MVASIHYFPTFSKLNGFSNILFDNENNPWLVQGELLEGVFFIFYRARLALSLCFQSLYLSSYIFGLFYYCCTILKLASSALAYMKRICFSISCSIEYEVLQLCARACLPVCSHIYGCLTTLTKLNSVLFNIAVFPLIEYQTSIFH